MRTEIKASALKRLNRVEGQVRGLAGMVKDDRYCIDIVTQIAAARAALRGVEEEILRNLSPIASSTRSRPGTRPTSGARSQN
jgi:DNA-binding FrmR family transcriptional regulator